MKIRFKTIIIGIIFLLVLVLGGIIYFYLIKNPLTEKQIEKQLKELSHGPCLSKDEKVNYKIEEKKDGTALATISISNKTILSIEISEPRHYHPIELHNCGVYVIKFLNYDQKKSIQKPGFKKELWKYGYDDTIENLVLFAEKDEFDVYHSYFGTDFRVDPTETYVVLEKSYLGHPDYALVIKDLQTKEDVFVLPLKEITEKYPDFEGSIGFNEWTKDGKYFWGNIFVGANVLAFFRIERDTWKYDIFETPPGTMGGDALNTELGYVTYDDGPPWTGDLDWAKLYQEEWEKEGKIVSFYLYNFFTNKKIVLATTTDTMWSFKPKWISDTELEYYTPPGEKKIYKINE